MAVGRPGVTGLVTDHYHYFQHGASGYYEEYNAFEFVRGHEFDAWREAPRDPDRALLAQIDTEAGAFLPHTDGSVWRYPGETVQRREDLPAVRHRVRPGPGSRPLQD